MNEFFIGLAVCCVTLYFWYDLDRSYYKSKLIDMVLNDFKFDEHYTVSKDYFDSKMTNIINKNRGYSSSFSYILYDDIIICIECNALSYTIFITKEMAYI